MKQPPRSPNEALLTKGLLKKVLLQGLTLFLATFLPFHYMVDLGVGIDYARSFSLITLIVGNVFLVLTNSSNTRYIKDLLREKGNKARLYINSIALIMAFLIVYLPVVQDIFKTTALSLSSALVAFILGVISTSWWEVVKITKNSKVIRE